MIGIGYACTLLRNDLTNRKIVIKKYAFLISFLNGIVLILYLLDVVTSLTLFFWPFIIGALLLIALNDNFTNSFLIMNNLDVTIAPCYSLLVFMKSLGEFSYALIFLFLRALMINFGIGSLITF